MSPPPFDITPFLDQDEGQHFDRKSLFEGPPVRKRSGGELAVDRGELALDRGELALDRGELAADRGELAADLGELELDPAVQAMIDGLGKRPRKEKLRRVILMLCQHRAWRPHALADALGRSNVRKLVDHHLSPMVGAGALERTEPDNLTSPNQAYRAARAPHGPLFDGESS